MELGFQGSGHELVLSNIGPVEFEPANAILHVCVPAQAVGFQVENLDVAVVVPGHDVAFFVVEGVAESEFKGYATAQQSTTTSSFPTTGSRLKTGDFYRMSQSLTQP